MIAAGQTVTNPSSGGLGVILNVREVAQTADGQVLAQYEAVEVQRASNTAALSPYSVAGQPNASAQSRIVDPRTLTEAQAVAGGVSRADYREARETAEDQDAGPNAANPTDLDPAEEAVVAQLQARDSAVRQEEKAHAAAAGPYGSAPQYEYQVGPDGKAYAIGGHVDVGVSMSGDSQERDRALATLQNAALAPNSPSGADMSAFRQASLKRATAAEESYSSTIRESKETDSRFTGTPPQSITISA
ncbi:hypothetical protein LPB41_00675 [Thalassospira sp. MA62]|nr:hypothetical protein [Thalassospira sp. MA62]